MLPGKSLPSVAQQLLCACISAVMRLHNTCCALVIQLLCSKLCNSLYLIAISALFSWWYNKMYLGIVRVACRHLKKKKVRFNRSFSMKDALVSIICCIFAIGVGYCHFQDIVGNQKSIRYYFAFSQKPRKLIGNNVTRNNCDKVFGMGCLNYSYISNASTS